MFLLGKIVAALLFPPGIFMLGLFAAILLLVFKHRKIGIGILSGSLVLLFLSSFAPFTDLVIAPLEDRYPPLETPGRAVAIVVLGGGTIDHAPEFADKAMLSPESMARASYAAILSRKWSLPLLYSGGNGGRGEEFESEAAAAKRFWLALGIDSSQIRLETSSLDTAGNSTLTKKILGSDPVILVTSAWHMPRAMLAFHRAGVEVVAAPTAWRHAKGPRSFLEFLPGAGAMLTLQLALHEYLGLAWYWFRLSSS